MIADILSGACDDIERELFDLPDTDADCLDEVHTILAAMRALQRKLVAPLSGWDYHAPIPCRHCGLPALDHDVLAGGLLCPRRAGGTGETFAPSEEQTA